MALYMLIGLLYWAINIFIRKLHRENQPEDGWYLTLVWVFLWPICFIGILIAFIQRKITKKI